jgi:uncharacterized membrane protein
MYIDLSFSTLLLLAIVLWALGGPSHYQRYSQEQRQDQAQVRAVAKAARHAARRRLFGSHPVLYGLLAWCSPVLLAGLLCALVP